MAKSSSILERPGATTTFCTFGEQNAASSHARVAGAKAGAAPNCKTQSGLNSRKASKTAFGRRTTTSTSSDTRAHVSMYYRPVQLVQERGDVLHIVRREPPDDDDAPFDCVDVHDLRRVYFVPSICSMAWSVHAIVVRVQGSSCDAQVA